MFGQNLYTSDGIYIGQKDELISRCVKGFSGNSVNLNGANVEVYQYCSCVIGNVYPNISSDDIITYMSEENGFEKILYQDDNLKLMIECFQNFVEIEDGFSMSQIDASDYLLERSKEECVKTVIEEDPNFPEEIAVEYCDCFMDKITAEDYTFGQLMEVEDINSVAFNEIAVTCMDDILKGYDKISQTNQDVTGEKSISTVPIIDVFNNGYKVKLSIGGIDKYYLIDTGSTNVVIDRNVERELLIEGIISKDNYTDKVLLTLANNEIVEAQNLIINNIHIGDYYVNNVTVSVVENGSLLCGKEFLDKFSEWIIDKKNKKLILRK